MKLEKIVVIKKKTQLEELVLRHATTSQVKFHLESRGQSYDECREAHQAYHQGLLQVRAAIPPTQRSQVVDKTYLDTFQFGDKDLIVVVGDPGLVVNAAKYVGEQPVIAVNPDQRRFDDIFTTCTPTSFDKTLQRTLNGDFDTEKLTMAEARLDDGQTLYALNDLFVGRKTHVSARYEIRHQGRSERQSSSGIIISTGTGSTGWLTSVVVGAQAIAYGRANTGNVPFARDAPHLMFVVREPFPSKITGTSIVYDRITEERPLKITSNIPQEGVIFSDGVESDYLEFNAGVTATIKPASKRVYLVREVK